MTTPSQRLIEIGRAVHTQQTAWNKAVKTPPGFAYSTGNIHSALVAAKVWETVEEQKQGWALLAKLNSYEFPGVRHGKSVVSRWKTAKGGDKMVRPLEWFHTTDEAMAKWEKDVLGHKRAVVEGETALLRKDVLAARVRIEALEQQMKELLAAPTAPVR
jgi:hypothetical protein